MKKSMIWVLGIILLILSVAGEFIFDNAFGEAVGEIITTLSAVIGAGAIFLQFRKEARTNKASFIMDINEAFHIMKTDTAKIIQTLENDRINNTEDIKNIDMEGIVEVLQWLEFTSIFVKQGVIKIGEIDDIFSYRFFLFVNNKYIQETEIACNIEFYQGIIWVYKYWYNFNKLTKQPIIWEETSLHLIENYEKYHKQTRERIKIAKKYVIKS